jgi:hypothetical protein
MDFLCKFNHRGNLSRSVTIRFFTVLKPLERPIRTIITHPATVLHQ